MGNMNMWNDPKWQTMRLDGESAMLPIDHNEDIANYFNKNI